MTSPTGQTSAPILLLIQGGPRPWTSDRGFSLLELTIVIAAIALLATLGLQRLWGLTVEAERVAMEQVLSGLRSAIGMNVANQLVRNDFQRLRALEAGNPMEQLAETPSNYLGALANPDPVQIEAGRWYFDSGNRTLVYRVRNAGSFISTLPGPARARFKLEVVYGEGGAPRGARLVAVESYAWTVDMPKL